MNRQIEKLHSIGGKDSRLIIGLMSGTSLDGLDVALCKIKGSGKHTNLSVLQFETIGYDEYYKNEVQVIFSKPIISTEKLCLLHEWIGVKHAWIINKCLEKWNIVKGDIDLIASHGQTIYHAPKSLHRKDDFGNATLQIGDADHIAVNTGIITISDFRQKHIAAGGEGAPLAAYGDYILFAEKDQDVILLNIGGIANFTFIPAGSSFDKIVCSDIGPGNTIMDAFVQKHFTGKYFDKDAAIAKTGKVNELLLNTLRENDFLQADFPKTTGPELFNLSYLEKALQKSHTTDLSLTDILATLNMFTASIICDSILKIDQNQNCKLFISGGGLHNPLLIESISKIIPSLSISNTREKNIHPDAKEAILFALLANECVAGNGDNFGEGSKHYPAVTMGKISLP